MDFFLQLSGINGLAHFVKYMKITKNTHFYIVSIGMETFVQVDLHHHTLLSYLGDICAEHQAVWSLGAEHAAAPRLAA